VGCPFSLSRSRQVREAKYPSNFPAYFSVCGMSFPDKVGGKAAKSLFPHFQLINSSNLLTLLTCGVSHTTVVSSHHPEMRERRTSASSTSWPGGKKV